MADGRSSASVVIVDAEKAAKARDEAARAQLQDGPVTDSNKLYVKKGVAHTVPYTLKVVASAEMYDSVETVAGDILAAGFQLIDTVLNNFNPHSEVSFINQMPVGQVHQMSAPMKRVLACCQRVHTSSTGSFDPAVGPLVKRLRETAENGETIPLKTLNELIRCCTLRHSFIIDFAAGTISRKRSISALDLGGVNKGYGVDYVVEKLNASGFDNVFFEWGGDVRASGVNSLGGPWTVGIARPPSLKELHHPESKKEATFIRVVQLNNEAIATSGDYENLVRSPQEQLFTSIFCWDTKSLLEPSETNIAQITIKCYSCMYADALATASLLKRQPHAVRNLLEGWRYVRDTVTDYTAYVREEEKVACMFEIATESPENRRKRIENSIPARVIVIGGGLAGQTAAITAADCGAKVILLEKEARLGGNSAKATSGINGWGTRAQANQGVMDGGKYFERDTYRSGVGGTCDTGLVKTLSIKSADAIRWLTSLGVPLTVLTQLGGASRKRCHRAPDKKDGTPVPVGFTIMQTLERHIRTKHARNITIMTNVTVTDLIHKTIKRSDGNVDKHVTGVTLTPADGAPMDLNADAVILATGGFSNDRTRLSLLSEFAPHLAAFPTTNGVWATGDGVKLARKLGAELTDMDKVQLHPTGLLDPKDPANRTKYLGPEALRGSGGILLNKHGDRFVDELNLRSVVSNAIIEQDNVFPESGGSRFAYCVLNDAAVKLFGVNALGFYWKKLGLFTKVDNVGALAKLIGCDAAHLQHTLEQYAQTSSGKSSCLQTGKSVFPCVLGPDGPFFVAYVTPSIHYTMGGCHISPSAELQVFDKGEITMHRRPILGLFGAGEVTGGVHGGNRLGGNSLLECVVFGKIAGDRAATILQKQTTALSMKTWVSVVLREVREGGAYGTGSRVLRFNLPGALQRTGLELGQFISIRGEWDGQQLVGYYSPITLPDDLGVIAILARSDKGHLREWIAALEPGDAVEMKACGGLVIERRFAARHFYFKNRRISKLCLIAGGTGIAPMLQIVRAVVRKPFMDSILSINLVYAAEDVSELTYRGLLEAYQREYGREKFTCNFVLNKPPAPWTDGVGFVDAALLRSAVQEPSNDLLIVICGPPIMQRVVLQSLTKMRYNMNLVRTVDQVDLPPPKL